MHQCQKVGPRKVWETALARLAHVIIAIDGKRALEMESLIDHTYKES